MLEGGKLDEDAEKGPARGNLPDGVLWPAGHCVGGDFAVSKPKPPCTRECPRRSMVCHDREICPDWGRYQDELSAWKLMVYSAKQKEDDLLVARRTEQARRKWQRQQK